MMLAAVSTGPCVLLGPCPAQVSPSFFDAPWANDTLLPDGTVFRNHAPNQFPQVGGCMLQARSVLGRCKWGLHLEGADEGAAVKRLRLMNNIVNLLFITILNPRY